MGEVFTRFVREAGAHGIVSWGMGQPRLEEVFLSIAREAERK